MEDVLREAVRRSGMPMRGVAKSTGVAQSILSVFMRGRDVRLRTAQRLADFFGLELYRGEGESPHTPRHGEGE